MSFFNNCGCGLFCCRPVYRRVCRPCCCCCCCCCQPCCRPCYSQPCGGSAFPIQNASDGFGGAEVQQNENFQPNAMNN